MYGAAGRTAIFQYVKKYSHNRDEPCFSEYILHIEEEKNCLCSDKLTECLQTHIMCRKKISESSFYRVKIENKLGLSWAKLSSSWDWALLQLNLVCQIQC